MRRGLYSCINSGICIYKALEAENFGGFFIAGKWASLAMPRALGARNRRFESDLPDHNTNGVVE